MTSPAFRSLRRADSAPDFRQACRLVTASTRISTELVTWFDAHRRRLPWRAEPGDRGDAYGVWVSEVMLQQTRVEVVRDYYARWMQAFPSLSALADASEDDVLRLWQGLGYYSRARRLREGARFVVENFGGHLPQLPAELQRVPGIGPYSAGAIASIAYGVRAPLVDGNVIRVLTRLFALAGDPAKNPLKKQLWQITAELVPETRPGDFNQALMELGALVCTPQKPLCSSCPLRRDCLALARGQVQLFPQLPKKPPPTPRHMVVLLLERRGRFLVEQQPATSRWWSGLWTFPFFEVGTEVDAQAVARTELLRLGAGARESSRLEIMPLAPFAHTVTRFRIQLSPLLIRVPAADSWLGRLPGRMSTRAQMAQLAMPAPHRRLQRGL